MHHLHEYLPLIAAAINLITALIKQHSDRKPQRAAGIWMVPSRRTPGRDHSRVPAATRPSVVLRRGPSEALTGNRLQPQTPSRK